MTTGIVRDQNLEKHIHKQMGCMAGFLQIFDRNQILTGKRIYSHKRLPPVTPLTPHHTFIFHATHNLTVFLFSFTGLAGARQSHRLTCSFRAVAGQGGRPIRTKGQFSCAPRSGIQGRHTLLVEVLARGS